MFEGAIVFLSQIALATGVMFVLYLYLRFHESTVIPAVLVAAVLSFSFAWVTHYAQRGDWSRSGYFAEGFECYLWGVVGWLTFIVCFGLAGIVNTVFRKERNQKTSHMFFDILTWVALSCVLFDLEAQHFESDLQIGYIGIVAGLYLLIYTVPVVIKFCERCRAGSVRQTSKRG